MEELIYLPMTNALNISDTVQDSIIGHNQNFTRLDTIIAKY
jgi:hypothetical protein